MEVIQTTDTTTVLNNLWDDWFPLKHTSAANIPRTVANRDWLKASLLFYGWSDGKNLKQLNISFVDGGAVFYYDRQPCCFMSVNWSGDTPALRFTYVDNRK